MVKAEVLGAVLARIWSGSPEVEPSGVARSLLWRQHGEGRGTLRLQSRLEGCEGRREGLLCSHGEDSVMLILRVRTNGSPRSRGEDDGARSFERHASQDETRTSSTVPDPSLSRPVNPSRTYHLFALAESFHGLTSRVKSTSLKVERLSPCQATSRRGGRFPPASALRCQSVRSLRPSRTSQYG